jgi:DNA-directed RNA polymerase specialized sigma24 family protein
MMELVGETAAAERQATFAAFTDIHGGRLRSAFVGRYGPHDGADVHADVMARAWADWDRIGTMGNPAGYLYTLGRTMHRRYRRWRRTVPFGVPEGVRDRDPDLFLSLGSLTEDQRVAVLLVHGHGATYQEVADLLGVPVTTVSNHVHRGLRRLRADLQEGDE